jgi:two-component sensor histidine kinase
VTRVFRRAVRGEGPLSLDFRIRRRSDGQLRWLEASGTLHGCPGEDSRVVGVLVDVTERRQAESRLRLTVGELNHRVKNTLAAVQSIASQTLRGTGASDPIPVAARSDFASRLLALARSHDVLTREGWTGADLAELVGLALAPHGGPDSPHLTVGGPPVRVPPRFAVPLGIALHELATNAARHGALSQPEGQVSVTWSLEPAPEEGGASWLRLRWREQGGPVLAGPPTRRGFGTRLLERGLARELGGTVTLTFPPEGVVCDIVAPLPAAPHPTAAQEAIFA